MTRTLMPLAVLALLALTGDCSIATARSRGRCCSKRSASRDADALMRCSTSRRDPSDKIRATSSSYGGSQRTEDISTGEHSPPWPKQGPASYFPSIEKKYGRSIAEWQRIIADCGLKKHMAIVAYLKSEHGMGHGHANALVAWTLAGHVARS